MLRSASNAARAALVCALAFGSLGTAAAQAIDEELNDDCASAQDITDLAPPLTITGSLDSPPDTPDVDFFLAAATPGSRLSLAMDGAQSGAGSLPDPFVGVFDSDCNLLAFNDDDFSLDARLTFDVPAAGRFFIAATSCCDDAFDGNGGSAGSYLLTLVPPPPPIESIAVRVVDAQSGEPVRGDVSPFASALLLECDAQSCDRAVTELNLDSEGRVLFLTNFDGEPISAGRYQVVAFAEGFAERSSEEFEVAADEAFDLGDLAIEPPLIGFTLASDCAALLPQGGSCPYAVRIANNTSESFGGAAWSIVDAFGLGSTLDFTRFEARTDAAAGGDTGTRRGRRIFLGANESVEFGFIFDVPGFVRDGAVFCTEIFVGLDPSPLVNTTRSGQLFCLEKGVAAFRALDEAEMHKRFAALDGRGALPFGAAIDK